MIHKNVYIIRFAPCAGFSALNTNNELTFTSP